MGHYSYECTGSKAYASRPSRSAQLNRALNSKTNPANYNDDDDSGGVADAEINKAGLANRILAEKQKARREKKKRIAGDSSSDDSSDSDSDSSSNNSNSSGSSSGKLIIRFEFGFGFGLGLGFGITELGLVKNQ
ncbi:hypothetical protein HK100_001005 [Physocladia obscura]|uniref:Uncharacterized protein n=1 Tax=Physocladia obscura TaxID=109957 RepID=A0AAD5SYG7_9FUNG|nr:hypothetical protein HK100_001005 [Physocladia obscura]